MDDITRIQRNFARKAQAQPTHRFRDLYSLVWKPSFSHKVHTSLTDGKAALAVNADGKPCAEKLARTVWEAA